MKGLYEPYLIKRLCYQNKIEISRVFVIIREQRELNLSILVVFLHILLRQDADVQFKLQESIKVTIFCKFSGFPCSFNQDSFADQTVCFAVVSGYICSFGFVLIGISCPCLLCLVVRLLVMYQVLVGLLTLKFALLGNFSGVMVVFMTEFRFEILLF